MIMKFLLSACSRQPRRWTPFVRYFTYSLHFCLLSHIVSCVRKVKQTRQIAVYSTLKSSQVALGTKTAQEMLQMATFEPVDFKVFGIIWAAVDLTVYPSIHVLQMATSEPDFFSAFDFKVFGTCPVVDTGDRSTHESIYL